MTDSAIVSRAGRNTRERILGAAVRLFAQHGYDGVSMRDVAAEVGLTQAALYYHFSDKGELYLDAITHEFRAKEAMLNGLLDRGGSPWERLESFVVKLAQMLDADQDLVRLTQWILLDCNEVRQQKLAKHVFNDMYVAVQELASELDASLDAHMLATSIFGLVNFHYQTSALRKFMPGYRPQQDKPEVVGRHVCNLLRRNLAEMERVPC